MCRAEPNGIINVRALFGRHGGDIPPTAGSSCANVRGITNDRHGRRRFFAWPRGTLRASSERALMTRAKCDELFRLLTKIIAFNHDVGEFSTARASGDEEEFEG